MIIDLVRLKIVLSRIPYVLGKPMSMIPFRYRPGISSAYSNSSSEIEKFSNFSASQRQQWILRNVKAVSCFAYKNTVIYKDYYKKHKFNPLMIDSFDDLKRIPIIDKTVLQSYDIDDRSTAVASRSLVNTGGSSGQPLEFYIQSSAIGHEWAHMHEAWRNIGFRFSDLKVMFVGRSLVRDVVDYDAGRHSLVVDTYKPWHVVVGPLKKKLFKLRPRFLHGYPSAIFDFLLWVADNDLELFEYFRNDLTGLILSSEFPSSALRFKVQELYNLKSLSFYGHTERCVLATEKEKEYCFHPFHTYGYAESIQLEDGHHLVGTSYYNFASPLIRYDTGDLITPVMSEGLMSSFSIESGRKGEFVLDRSGHKVFLTALIFGRHHDAFNYVSHVQVFQPEMGTVFILVSGRNQKSNAGIRFLFDFSNVEIEFEFYIGDKPLKTVSGKVPLLVTNMSYDEFEKTLD